MGVLGHFLDYYHLDRTHLGGSTTGALEYERVFIEVTGAIRSIDPDLDLSGLKAIRASADCPGLLREILKEEGGTVAATERADGVGIAMLVHGNGRC